ncbi:MAG: hypothetical protein FJ266_12465 [Planctomycetes bacterium]|nr:hypothetical protein [Planctomycetota bacterium]
MEIILDKSYLQAAKEKEISSLCNEHFIIFPEELLYELVTTKETALFACFKHLPDQSNPVALMPRLAKLIQYELGLQRPCTPLRDRIFNVEYDFNRALRSGTYAFTNEMKSDIAKWKNEIVEDTTLFIKQCQSIDLWFPKLKDINSGLPDDFFTEPRALARDRNFVRAVYAKLNKPVEYPDPSIIDEQWAVFRSLQTDLMAGILYAQKYGTCKSSCLPKAPEHDYIDLQLVVLSCLAGGIASRDERFVIRLLRQLLESPIVLR